MDNFFIYIIVINAKISQKHGHQHAMKKLFRCRLHSMHVPACMPIVVDILIHTSSIEIRAHNN